MKNRQYELLSVHNGLGQPCKSHEVIEVQHLFGNTNWEYERVGDTLIRFTCLVCGETRTYKIIEGTPEKTLL